MFLKISLGMSSELSVKRKWKKSKRKKSRRWISWLQSIEENLGDRRIGNWLAESGKLVTTMEANCAGSQGPHTDVSSNFTSKLRRYSSTCVCNNDTFYKHLRTSWSRLQSRLEKRQSHRVYSYLLNVRNVMKSVAFEQSARSRNCRNMFLIINAFVTRLTVLTQRILTSLE